jgi:hypothetical protein
MNANIDTTSLILFSFFTLYFAFRHLSQIREIKTQQFLIIAQFVACIIFITSQILLLNDIINIFRFEYIFKIIITIILAINLTHISLIAMNIPTKKKIKTLWRVPLTGLFAGMYFELKYIPFICLGYFVLCFVVLWGERVKYRYLLSKLLLFIPAMMGIFYISMNYLASLNILLLWVLGSCSFVMTASSINSYFKLEDKVE